MKELQQRMFNPLKQKHVNSGASVETVAILPLSVFWDEEEKIKPKIKKTDWLTFTVEINTTYN